jgi:hypothetical protein
LRVLHRMTQYSSQEISVAKVLPCDKFDRLDQLTSKLSANWQFNHWVVQRIAQVFRVPEIDVFTAQEYPEYPLRTAQRNLLSTPPTKRAWDELSVKIINRILSYIRSMPSLIGRCKSVGFSGSDYYLALNGFYGPLGILQSRGAFRCAGANRDEEVRKHLTAELGPRLSAAMATLLERLAGDWISEGDRVRLGDTFVEFLVTNYPVNLLEGMTQNIDGARRSLVASSTRVLIGTEFSTTDEGYFLAAEAKRSNIDVVGVQHGGHYGYIDSNSLVAEFEYSTYDKLITWGWDVFDDGLPRALPIILPVPRLSELTNKNRLTKPIVKNKGEFRILLMSNLLHRFPHASTCGQARIDFIDEIVDGLKRLVQTIAGAGIKIDHKPFNESNVDFLEDYYQELKVLGGDYYRCLTSKQKGLSPDLLRDYNLVLWDQVGTGTLECFVSKVPTMVYWERIYSRESNAAAQYIEVLEALGVIHSKPTNLVVELMKFKNDPVAWMGDKQRQHAIKNFCRRYALTEKNWVANWKSMLNALGSR